MRKLFIILIFIPVFSYSQQITVDSLASVIRTMQLQIAELQKPDTLTHTAGQFTVTIKNPKHKIVSINNYAAMNSSGTVAAKASTDVAALTVQLNAANAKITTLTAQVTALQTKVTGLKATSTTTTVIQ